jgi:hypothetical protein
LFDITTTGLKHLFLSNNNFSSEFLGLDEVDFQEAGVLIVNLLKDFSFSNHLARSQVTYLAATS